MALQHEDQITDFDVTHGSLEAASIDGLVLRTGHLRNVNLGGAVLERLELTDVCLTDCDMANVEFRQASMHRVQFVRCRLTGARLPETTTQDLLFRRCIGNLSQFRYARLPSCRFENCDLQEADFQGADLAGAVFSECDLRNVEMSQASLNGTDLTSSTIDGLRANPESLQGLIIEPHQAPHVAVLFGVEIR